MRPEWVFGRRIWGTAAKHAIAAEGMYELGLLLDRAVAWGSARRARRSLLASVVYLTTCLSSGQAAEIVIFDFEDVPVNNDYGILELEQGGVTVAIRHQNIPFAVNERIDEPPFDDAFGDRAISAFNGSGGTLDPGALVVDFNPPMSRVSVDMGDFGEDDDLLELEAYSGPLGTGSLVARDSSLLVAVGEQFSFDTLAVQGASIRSLVMIGGVPTFPNSVFYDNIAGMAVPEPATWLTICIGVLGLAGAGRRARGENGKLLR